MGDEIYRPLIEDIVWSYSNLETFDDCRYRWFLKYISKLKSEDKFYASYGLFMHTLLEKFYRGEMSKDDMLTTFLTDFSKEVKGTRPKASIVQKYIQCGIAYLESFIDVYELVRKKDNKQFGYSIITKSIGSGKESRFTVVNKVYDEDPIHKGDIIYCKGYEMNGQFFRLTRFEKVS